MLSTTEFGSQEWWDANGVLKSLSEFAGIEFDAAHVPEYSDETRESLLRALFQCNSRDVAVMVSDLLGFEERINVPGIMDGTNWAWRLDMTVEDAAKLVISAGLVYPNGKPDEDDDLPQPHRKAAE